MSREAVPDGENPMKASLLAVSLAFVPGCTLAADQPKKSGRGVVGLTWYGQSCFLLVSPKGTRVLVDPIPEKIGYTLPSPIPVDLVTISHEHFDHTNLALATGSFRVLRGLTEDQKDWQKHDTKVKDVRVRNVGVYHDQQKGALRGLNSIFVFETAGLRIVHLGDLGHLLEPEHLKKIGKADVVMVPTGGFYTIDAKQAHEVIGQLKPRYLIVPMHYRTDVLTIKELAVLDAFLTLEDPVTKHVERVDGNSYQIDTANLPKEPKIVVLNYK